MVLVPKWEETYALKSIEKNELKNFEVGINHEKLKFYNLDHYLSLGLVESTRPF